MSDKQTVLGRIAQLTKANINSLLDHAEDPGTMLDQLVRDYTNTIAEAEDAVAQTIGNLRMSEQDHTADLAAAAGWGQKAAAASRRADQMRAAGNTADAQKYDDLARLAIAKQISADRRAADAQPLLTSQAHVVENLRSGLIAMREKLSDLRTRRDSLVARQKTADAQNLVQGAISRISVLDPTTEVSRFEDGVRRAEAYAAGQAEIAGLSLDAQFEELDATGADLEVETRLAALKAGSR